MFHFCIVWNLHKLFFVRLDVWDLLVCLSSFMCFQGISTQITKLNQVLGGVSHSFWVKRRRSFEKIIRSVHWEDRMSGGIVQEKFLSLFPVGWHRWLRLSFILQGDSVNYYKLCALFQYFQTFGPMKPRDANLQDFFFLVCMQGGVGLMLVNRMNIWIMSCERKHTAYLSNCNF